MILHVNKSYQQGGQIRVKLVTGDSVKKQWSLRRRNVWYMYIVVCTVTLFSSVLGQNYEVALFVSLQ